MIPILPISSNRVQIIPIFIPMTGKGRPKLPDGIARDVTMSVRLTLEQRQAVSAAADRDGFESDSEWARHILLKTMLLDQKLRTPQQQVDIIVHGDLPVASEAILEPHAVTTRSLTIEKQPEQPPKAPVAELTKSEPGDNTVSPPIKKVRKHTSNAVHVVEPYRTRPLPKLPHPGAIYTRPASENLVEELKVPKHSRARRFASNDGAGE